MRQGLKALGQFAGMVALDRSGDVDEDNGPPGAMAPVAVLAMPPVAHMAVKMLLLGRHERRLALLPPNSSYVPEGGLLDNKNDCVTGLISPSQWGATVLRAHTGLPVTVWPHGVDSGFKPDAQATETVRREYEAGRFEALHMASTGAERKGTRLLLRAWCELVSARALGDRPILRLVVNDTVGGLRSFVDELVAGRAAVERSIVWAQPRLNMSPENAAQLYRSHHVVVQPSRGEGFGMIPLESRACGVPIVSTICTGHSEHMSASTPGVILVDTGAPAPIDDGPGAMAPSLTSADIASSLARAREHWPRWHKAAQAAAPSVGVSWSWRAVTETWLQKEGLR
jgi:glycosyltransferase involved in cell wall biosynthesis